MVFTASGDTGPEITLTEKIIARLWRADSAAPGKLPLLLITSLVTIATTMWSHPVLNYTTEIIQEPLISLPSSALGSDAIQLFRVSEIATVEIL